MPRKLAKQSSSVKRRKLHRRPTRSQIGTAAGRIAENVAQEVVPVDRNTGVFASYAQDGKREGLFDAAARI